MYSVKMYKMHKIATIITIMWMLWLVLCSIVSDKNLHPVAYNSAMFETMACEFLPGTF
jgi:hypothetical protein